MNTLIAIAFMFFIRMAWNLQDSNILEVKYGWTPNFTYHNLGDKTYSITEFLLNMPISFKTKHCTVKFPLKTVAIIDEYYLWQEPVSCSG